MASTDLEKSANRGYANGAAPVYYEPAERSWTSWLIPVFVVVNVAMFIVVMFVNNCPKNNVGFEGDCVARFLGRLSFQPLKENPLFGPSSSTFDFDFYAREVNTEVLLGYLRSGIISPFQVGD